MSGLWGTAAIELAVSLVLSEMQFKVSDLHARIPDPMSAEQVGSSVCKIG